MNEKDKFINIREEFSKKLEPATVNLEKSCWDFYINSNDKTMKQYQKAQENYYKLFHNQKLYSALKGIDNSKLPKHEAKQLKDLIKEFEEEINSGDELKALRQKENEIAQKYNSYIPKIDNKEVSKTELTKILQTEIDQELRKKAYDAKILGGDLIADDLIDFVKMRND